MTGILLQKGLSFNVETFESLGYAVNPLDELDKKGWN